MCLDNSYSSDSMQVVNWNYWKKGKMKFKHMEYYRTLYLTFIEYDGNVLRREVFSHNQLTINDRAPAGQTDDQVCVIM